ncbi:hypothetical protein RGUI_3555 [Rhodovulum sp. P5]|uniref:hypothetical protein n=1 Tax=Rhodovulum sp. P5 TaxID=1564506 RepID=UPI0009C28A5E|nr:hypothetical protein [Rhodovulum sp. P5]ARE41696.1 hypothetical protein RGUI_3555 [Rhodovulum sp. P5]
MNKTFDGTPDLASALGLALQTTPMCSVGIDMAKYREVFDDPDLPDAEKDAIILALWGILVNFADLGFGVHPVQEACGKVENVIDRPAQGDSDGVDSGQNALSEDFNTLAGVRAARKDG